ncbi:HAD-superfamily subfamily IB hydrolase, TIGR01490 [Chitinophaga costaii]|uniref:HAD-superfamily subfamily IB hydrolase, TIGR01490 n=1 Tax=Chitinophaga costaii TaxID=1335309 RepID=A0A1C4FFQ7_9BACT|nr:HAD-IB family hydrolase [Chitinophaga costaii]SCC54750.1 HAD-superfamily subfamily IB hydrolase, TIGR01490 [Chitinophaga costaii]
MAGIAFFDFDGTITKHDTLFGIIRYAKGDEAFKQGMYKLLPSLIKFKLKIISAQEVKERVLTYFFKGMPLKEFREMCDDYGLRSQPVFIRSAARDAIVKHQAAGHRVIVVTASAEEWVRPFCLGMRVELIGSRLETDAEGRLTGKLSGLNCNGKEKVNRIKALVNLSDYSPIFAYGDSRGDRPMLALAGSNAVYKPFRY